MAAPKAVDYGQKAPQNIGAGLARSFGQGLLFGFGDEVEAFVRSLQKDVNYDDALQEARSELQSFREQAPAAAYGTEFIGALPSTFFTGPTGLLGRLGLQGTGKIAATQSALYGAGTGEDTQSRLQGAAIGGALGGAVGVGADKLLPAKSKVAQDLQKKGIPLTPGQALRDQGSVGSTLITALEDLSTSYPGAGAPIQAKRLESLILFNKRLLEEAVEPLKIKLPKNASAKESYEFIDDILNKKYESIIPKLKLTKTDDLETNILNALEKSIFSSSDQSKVLKILDKTIFDNIVDGQLSGKNLKNAQTNLNRLSTRFLRQGGFEGEIGVFLKQTKNLLDDQINLQNPNSKELFDINKVYANLIPINKAMQSAITQEGVFTPAQILRALKQTDQTKMKQALIKGQKPLQETAEEANKILLSQFPDSGTASRLLAQDVIVNPLKLGKLAPPAVASELLMSRPFGMSPATGLLTSVKPVTLGATPTISGLSAQQILENQRQARQEYLNSLLPNQ